MQIAVTGSTGFIGSEAVASFRASGHDVIRMVREGPYADDRVHWNPKKAEIDSGALEGIDAVVHLAGESIGGNRWTETKKKYIDESRFLATRFISETLAGLNEPPKVMVSGSAVGFYGVHGDEVLTEEAPSGGGFLAGVVRRWEAETAAAEAAGVRVAHIRTGIVLSPKGGALREMLLPFKLGLGGRLGSGRQYWSWISLTDEISAIDHLISSSELSGPVNLTAPQPVTQHEFAKTLARVLGRPALLPTPTIALRALYGDEMVRETLTGGQRVVPARLEADGFRFHHPDLSIALRAELQRPA